ncbi:type II toxin-antitoxin system prevent-host-death family antitoxin [Streptomyces anulatus]|uniref:type II toxin-antitoxin system prevent-host-death family antitoxin n=1 Tax=Streptomyces anulatus TaxID=1892 RepID=UPI00342C62D5
MTTATARTALYRLFGATGQLLYVGITTQPETRWTQHAADKPWWPLVRQRNVEWHPSRPVAERAELAAIRTEAPLYNSANARKSLLAEHFPIGDSLTQAQARVRFSDVLDATQFGGRSIEITRRGRRAGVLVPPEWYAEAVAAIAELRELRRENTELRRKVADSGSQS